MSFKEKNLVKKQITTYKAKIKPKKSKFYLFVKVFLRKIK